MWIVSTYILLYPSNYNVVMEKEMIEVGAIIIMAVFSFLSFCTALSAYSKIQNMSKEIKTLKTSLNNLKEHLKKV